jgi:hypothetical protein
MSDDDLTIHPTHTCFTDAMEMIDQVIRDAPEELPRHTLVHAIAVLPGGELFAHAWVERFTRTGSLEAWQRGIWQGHLVTFAVAATELAVSLKVQRQWRYTPAEALAQNLRSGMFGPWEPELQALCGSHVCAAEDVGYGHGV